MGLRMAAQPLEGGRYFVLWPTDAPLRSCGQRFVVDAYSKGALFLLDEARASFSAAWHTIAHASTCPSASFSPVSSSNTLAVLHQGGYTPCMCV